MSTRFIVVRHGETQWNVESRIQGQGDSPLTEAGGEQARAIAQRLAREKFDVLVASDLGRAMDTARAIAELSGHAIVPDPRLRERSFGVGEGMTYEEIDRAYPNVFSRTAEADPDFVIPVGESRRQFHDRVRDAFVALAREHPGKRLTVVAHGGVLAGLYRHIHDIPVGKPHVVPIANAAYNAVVFQAPAWALEAWDEVDHLPAAVPFVES
ncbi:MAG TPA: histidine phosphatase family protein [Usitatibacter sp.]|nr:histidine phosphatase family protein [Usitatibacter sp.]